MEQSPGGHDIEVVFGNPGGIKARGEQVESLGDQMIGAAGVLRAIADNGVPQKGLSIEKIKEVIGEIDEELKLAGQRYKPSGTALVDYARALEDVQGEMRLIVPRCRTAWDDYETARHSFGSVEGDRPPASDEPHTGPGPSPAEEHQQDVAAARGRMEDAYDEFIAEARQFDTQYQTWEAAFDAATEGIRGATDGGIKDGFWDNVDGIVDGILVVLQWAGIVLAVLAFIVGGPIIAALGAIVAVATLLLTAYAFGRGDKNGWDLALAIVGVIPFGKLAAFSGGGRAGATAMLEGFTGGLGTAAGRATLGTALRELPTGLADAWRAGLSVPGIASAFKGSSAFDDVANRIMGMGDAAEGTAAATTGWGAAGLVTGHYGWVLNTPFATGSAIWDFVSGKVEDATVSDWADQLATSS